MSESEPDQNQKENSEKESQGRDSRFDAFLRQASAVIAAEKGMTLAAQTKIKSIADRLKLPSDLYETGLVELQDSGAPIGDLTRYEEAFLKSIGKEFEKLSGGVLSIAMEENAVKKAELKFGIASHRADRLIDYQATQSGVGRLARAGASSYAKQAIAEQIGNALTVDSDSEQKFYKLGRKWGLGNEQVQAVVLESLGRNRRKVRLERRQRIAKWAGSVLALAIIGGGGFFGYQWIVDRLNAEPIVEVPRENGDPGSPDVESADTLLENKKIGYGVSVIAPKRAADFASEQAVVRADAYASVTDKICSDAVSKSVSQKQKTDLLGEIYFTELEESAANRILESVGSHMSDSRNQSLRELKSIYRANRLAALIYGYPDADSRFVNLANRKNRLAQVLSNRTGVDPSRRPFPDYIQSSEQSLAVEQWNWLVQNSWTAPGRSAGLVEPLFELTKDKLEPETLEQFRTRSLHTILEADRNRWRDLKRPIMDSVKQAGEVGAMDWIAIFETGNPGLREFLAPVLAEKVGLKATSRLANLEKGLKLARTNYRNRLLGSVLDRNRRIDVLMQDFAQRESAVSGTVTPDIVAHAINLGNHSLELNQIIHAGRSREELAYESLDEHLADSNKRLREIVFLDSRQSGNRAVAATASLNDQQTKARVISRLKDVSQGSRALRISAVDQLGRISKKFPDIAYEEAAVLANYLLSELDTEELLEAQQDASLFSHWTNLQLAASDLIVDSKVGIDQALTMSNLLTNVRFEVDRSERWREKLSWQMFKHAKESLSNSEIDPNSLSGDWERLRKFVLMRYQERSNLFGGRSSDSQANSPVEVLSKMLKSSTAGPTSSANKRQRIERTVNLVAVLSDNEIEQLVLLNRLLIKEYVEKIRSLSSESARQSDLVFSNFEMQMERDSDSGMKYFYTEACLARLFSLERKIAIEQLLERF